jgi:hypothetical protein
MRGLRRLFRENPQVVLLALIGLIFGVGAFIVVLIALINSGSTTPSGDPSGAVELLRSALGALAA